MQTNSQQAFLKEIQLLLEPVVAALESDLSRDILFKEIGWELEAIAGFPLQELLTRLTQFRDGYDRLREVIAHPPDTLPEFLQALETVDQLYTTMRELRTVANKTALEVPQFEQIGQDLIASLTIHYLQTWHPLVYSLAVLLTLIQPAEEAPFPEAIDEGLAFPPKRPRLKLERLSKLLNDPVDLLTTAYIPFATLQTAEQAQQVTDKLFPRLGRVLGELGWNYLYGIKPAYGLDFGAAGNALGAGMLTVFLDSNSADMVGATLALSPGDHGGLGLVVVPFGGLTLSYTLGRWQMDLVLQGAVEGFAIGPQGLTLPEGADDAAVTLRLNMTRLPDEEEHAFLLGSTTGTRLEIGQFTLSATGTFQGTAQDYGFLLEARAASLILMPQEGDRFLRELLPPGGLQVDFDLAFGWSNRQGFYFQGSTGLEAQLPVHRALGPALSVDLIYLAVHAQDEDIRSQVAATYTVRLGPVTATVEQVGLEAMLTFSPQGNLGVADLQLGFKAPTGVGLTINAAAVTGGGYVSFDPSQDRYAGVLQLRVAERSLDGVVISEGNSLLGVVWLRGLGIPVVIGSIDGLGVLLGCNRRGDRDAFLQGLKSGALDAVLFPDNPVAAAPQVLATLGHLFPRADHHTILGIMAQWVFGGQARLAVAEVGILLEFERDRLQHLYIVGQGRMRMRQVPEHMFGLNIELFGDIDFASDTCLLMVALRNSKLAGNDLRGDGLLYYSPDKGFVVSVGGFNPRYPVPQRLPSLERVTMHLVNRDQLKIALQAYVALTPTSFQIGGRVSLWAGVAGFALEGFVGLDVLTQFDGEFLVDLAAELALKRGNRALASIEFTGTLSGMSMWRINGKATFKFLFFKATLSFDYSWGESRPALPAAVDALIPLLAALRAPENWSVQAAPAGVVLLERPRQGVWMDALHTLRVRQAVVPLDVTVTRLGPSPLQKPQTFRIAQVTLGHAATPIIAWRHVEDNFAPSLYQDLDLDEALVAPVFEKMHSGMELSHAALSLGNAVDSGADYEDVVIDAAFAGTAPGASLRVAAAPAASTFYQTKKQAVVVHTPRYVIADDSLQPDQAHGTTGVSYTQARDQLRTALGRGGRRRIVRRHEVAKI
jgi:hypothetical protein